MVFKSKKCGKPLVGFAASLFYSIRTKLNSRLAKADLLECDMS